MKLIKRLGKNEEGSALVVGIFSLTTLLAFLGLAMDIGHLVCTKSQMQNAVDAATCAGALEFTSMTVPPSSTDQSNATSQANTILQSNGFPSVTVTPTFPNTAKWNNNAVPAILISFTQTVPTFVMGVLGISSVQLSATAEAVLTSLSALGAPFTYNGYPNTLFSVKNLTMNGSQSVKGSIFTDGTLNMNGSEVVNGNAVGVNGINMNGSEHITGFAQADTVQDIHINGSEQIVGGTQAGAQNITLPDFSQAIINNAQSANTYNSSQTFNGITNANGPIYVKGDVTINGSVNWTGSIVATGSITINGSSQITGSNQVFLYSQNGNITMNGSTSFGTGGANGSNVIAYAPNGTIIINGSSTWYGLVLGNQLTINGSGNFDGSGVTNLNSLPPGAVSLGPSHSKLIN